MQDDHLAVVEEEDVKAKASVKKVQALDKGTCGTILIEALLNHLLLHSHLVVKVGVPSRRCRLRVSVAPTVLILSLLH